MVSVNTHFSALNTYFSLLNTYFFSPERVIFPSPERVIFQVLTKKVRKT